MAREGADELVASGRRSGEGGLSAFAWADEDRRRNNPGVVRRQPVVILAGSQAVQGHVVFGAHLDQGPVMGVCARGVIEGHHNLRPGRRGHAVDIKLQGVTVHVDVELDRPLPARWWQLGLT